MTKKATRKFAAKGQLKKTIQTRRKHQQFKKKIQNRRGKPSGPKPEVAEEEDSELEVKEKGQSAKATTVDDFLNADFIEDNARFDVRDVGVAEETEEEDVEEDAFDDHSFASVDDLEDEGEAHLIELSKLAEKDPEFYQYLLQNDRELLNFDPNAMVADENDHDDKPSDAGDIMDVDSVPVLTKAQLRHWQKALLEQRSLRSLRKLLLAFRSAVHMSDEIEDTTWIIDSPSVYDKLIRTTLKYTPIVLQHHVPYKTLKGGKFKPPTQTPKLGALQKMIQSYFRNVIHLLDQLADDETVEFAVTESSKIIPWVISSRRAVKLYLKKCLELWSSASNNVRAASYSAIQKLAFANDDSVMDQVIKGMYTTFVRSCKSTLAHTLPSINFLKNSANDILCMNPALAYQHAFGYIRQLAILLRESLKVKTKEAYKQVYNWQYVHCVDFWSRVLAQACGNTRGGESDLKPLIYPLVQVSLGALRLIANAHTFPFHLHILRSLLHLSRHTDIYIPLASHIVPIITAVLTSPLRPKASTLRPLDLEVVIRAPTRYLKTRVYYEVLTNEAAYLLAEWLSSPGIQASVAFPEIVIGIVVALRKGLKAGKAAGTSGKEIGTIKSLVMKIEESAKWVEERRQGIAFGPGKYETVRRWESTMQGRVGDSPLGKYVKVIRTAREKQKALLEKAIDGEAEILED